jgi:hypothetical protein
MLDFVNKLLKLGTLLNRTCLTLTCWKSVQSIRVMGDFEGRCSL